MGDIKIRNLDSVVINKLDELAKKKKLSREEYLRKHLMQLVSLPPLEEMENKYQNLVLTLSEQLERYNEVLEINNALMEKVLEKFCDD